MQVSKQVSREVPTVPSPAAPLLPGQAPSYAPLWRWRWRRLARMAPAEVLHRVQEALARRALRRRQPDWQAYPAQRTLGPLFALYEPLRFRSVALAPAVRRAAAALRAGGYSALGAVWPPDPSFPAEAWRRDPVTATLWPDGFSFDIAWRHDEQGRDVKHVWEFNRLQFLPVLAADVALNGADPASLDAALTSWREANPPFRGVAWASGIEIALRAVSIAFAVGWAGRAIKPQTLGFAEQILRAHHDALRRFPSRHSSANNHVIAEALGELVIEMLLPDLGDGSRSRAVLEAEAIKQIYADGVGAEQSPTYAAFTVEMLLTADLFLRARGRKPLSLGLRARIDAFAGWIAWMADAAGRVPNIGDDDEGRVLTLGAETNYVAAVAQAAGSGELRPPCARSPTLRDVYWPPRAAPPAPEGVKVFEVGGYTVVRERRAGRAMRLTFDHGPLGYLSIAAHGHADANAILLSLDDDDILVDAGTYLYHSGGAWRDAFRCTAAHNTLCLDGRDQSPIWGPFNWGPPARTRLVAAETGADWRLAAVHDGYRRRYGVNHQRELRATASGFALTDSLIGGPCALEATCGFQVAPGLTVDGEGLDWRIGRGGWTLLRIRFSAPGEVGVVCGDVSSRRGWVSPAFGEKRPAPQLVWRGIVPAEGAGVAFVF